MDAFSRLPKAMLNDDLMSAQAKMVYAALDGYLDKKTGECCPTLTRLAADLGISRRWAIEIIQWLEAHRWIVVARESGRPNRYLAEPSPRGGYVLARGGEADFTGEVGFTGTREVGFTSPPEALIKGSKNGGENKKEQEPPPPNFCATNPGLFHAAQQRSLRGHVEYLLGEHPDRPEAGLRGWFPALVSEFFLAQSWDRPTDPEQCRHWARQLAGINATEAEVAANFAWALAGALDATGRKVFSRPDHLRRIVGRILAKRREQAAPKAAQAAGDCPGATIASAVEAEAAWEELDAQARAELAQEVEERLGRASGHVFASACRAEALRRRARSPPSRTTTASQPGAQP